MEVTLNDHEIHIEVSAQLFQSIKENWPEVILVLVILPELFDFI